ncbi:alpha/beta hydrolase [Lysobacter cavernae]|uniref:Alpha/beta hydrolase n=1 Tax=Lysobacter cavernae TaxID=1685901 RepID=A0ABV7RNY6_9GAMM
MSPGRCTYVTMLLACIVACTGCTTLADRIAEPPHSTALRVCGQNDFERALQLRQEQLRTRDGVTIGYRVVDPADRGLQYRFERDSEHWTFKFDSGDYRSPIPLPARGTVIYLHGWSLDGASMLPWALALGQEGYRGLVVDLRNHGHSSRAPAGYGTREADDIVDLIHQWRADGTIQGPLYLFGVSYGAVAAVFAANRVAPMVAGVIAIAPYANAADGVRGMIDFLLNAPSSNLPARWVSTALRWRYDAAAIDQAIDDAGRQLGLDLHQVDITATVAASSVCTALIHGRNDRAIPVAQARGLAGGPMLRYAELPDDDHLTAAVRVDWLATPIVDWMHQIADVGHCGDLALPEDPAISNPTRVSRH